MRLCILAALCALITAACEENNRLDYLPGNTGNQGEMIVVAPGSFWTTAEADSLRRALLAPLPVLPIPEPIIKPVEVKTEGFTNIFKTHRNILEIRIDPENATSVQPKKDRFARQQLYVLITLQRKEDLMEVIERELPSVLWLAHKAEVDRLISRNKAFGSKEFNNKVKETTGLSLFMQDGYIMVKSDGEACWLRLDRQKPVGGFQHDIRQGILIYSRPYIDTIQFQQANLLEWKNQVSGAVVSGTGASRMVVSERMYLPESILIRFKNQIAREIRGLWRMEGEPGVFMGGPFYALAFHHPKSGKQYMIEGYVFAPQFDKSALIREIEAIAKSIELD